MEAWYESRNIYNPEMFRIFRITPGLQVFRDSYYAFIGPFKSPVSLILIISTRIIFSMIENTKLEMAHLSETISNSLNWSILWSNAKI